MSKLRPTGVTNFQKTVWFIGPPFTSEHQSVHLFLRQDLLLTLTAVVVQLHIQQ